MDEDILWRRITTANSVESKLGRTAEAVCFMDKDTPTCLIKITNNRTLSTFLVNMKNVCLSSTNRLTTKCPRVDSV